MFQLRWLVGLLVLLSIATGCGPKMVSVASGEKIICSECGKIIRSDVRALKVAESEVTKYSVRGKQEICPKCQAKIDAQKRAEEERRRAEEARLAREREREQERQRAIQIKQRMTGTWIYRSGLGSATIKLFADGRGSVMDAPFRWKSEGSTGFRGTVDFDSWGTGSHPKPHVIFGHILSNGNLFTNFEPMFGSFKRNEETIFERVE